MYLLNKFSLGYFISLIFLQASTCILDTIDYCKKLILSQMWYLTLPLNIEKVYNLKICSFIMNSVSMKRATNKCRPKTWIYYQHLKQFHLSSQLIRLHSFLRKHLQEIGVSMYCLFELTKQLLDRQLCVALWQCTQLN